MQDCNKYDYVLVLKKGGSYFSDSLFGLFTEIMIHRFVNW